MNISPTTWREMVNAVATLQTQVATLLHVLSDQKTPRDPSIAGFCRRHGISRGTYQNLRQAGKGPREFAAGTRRVISEEAEADWIRDRQLEAEAAAGRRKG